MTRMKMMLFIQLRIFPADDMEMMKFLRPLAGNKITQKKMMLFMQLSIRPADDTKMMKSLHMINVVPLVLKRYKL